MIRKAKTKKNLILILNAIFGVVFAFMIGVTYAFQSSTLTYGTKLNSASAYMTNQQVEVVNDTLESPIPFGIGENNHEISVQYSVGYEFDIRLEYSLSWSGGSSTDNVILNFSDRDNFIVDDQYIYYASRTDGSPSGIQAGNGKLTVIVGVDFVDTEDLTYNGQTLTINMTAKIYKVQETYSGTHALYVSGSKASEAWLKYKDSASLGSTDANSAYVMVYNYRHDYSHGVPYVGPRTAYKRTYTESGTTKVLNMVEWLGGNKAYAGTGIYVITGSQAVELTVSVQGLWRTSDSATSTGLFASSIQYNYTEINSEKKTQWVHAGYDDQLLFETRNYNFPIPENTTCYIQILDSVEVNSIKKEITSYDDEYDISRLVTNTIVVNGSTFTYSADGSSKGLLCGLIANTEATSQTTTYSKPKVEIINASKYSNGMFVNNADTAGNTLRQTFKSSLTFVNNTSNYQTVSLTNGLKSFVGNGKILVVEKDATTKPTEFSDDAYYQDVQTLGSSYYSITMDATSFTLAPYGSMSYVVTYTANSDIYAWLKTTYSNGSDLEKYDAWLQLDPSITTSTALNTKNLIVESDVTVSGSNSILTFSVKNASNKRIIGISANISLETSVYTLTMANSYPNDWKASYWKYFDSNGVRATYQNMLDDTPKPDAQPPTTFPSGKWYAQSHSYSTITLTTSNVSVGTGYTANVSTSNVCTITNSSQKLQPNETIQIAVITVATTEQIIVDASASGSSVSDASDVSLVNSGKDNAYIINHTSDAYYVRFTGTIDESFDMSKFKLQDGYYYYLDIVRANQIITLDMTGVGALEFKKFTNQGWTNDATEIAGFFSA